MLEPASIDELSTAIKGHPKVLAVGGRTKPTLSAVEDVELLSLKKLAGITQYEPSEFTFTALAGTPVHEVTETLAGKGQYLPFDPCFVEAGATLGGTVASGISGAGRFRFGGVRDFLIGIRFIDGTGRLLTGGGKVVKNAAGFDTPKLMVGSLGRLGVLAELTFKVFPKPESLLTLKISCASHDEGMSRLTHLASGRWELDALDYRATDKTLIARLGGPKAALDELAGSIATELNADVARMAGEEASQFWNDLQGMKWVSNDALVAKVPLTPGLFLALHERVENIHGCSLHLTAGGGFAWLTIAANETLGEVSAALTGLELGGLVIKGSTTDMWFGHRPNRAIDVAVKNVFDPEGRFPAF